MTRPQRWGSVAELAQHMARRQTWLPLREAADLYRVTPETMLAWVRGSHFTGKYFDGALWVARDELESALRRRPDS
jgi:hypothetical protein